MILRRPLTALPLFLLAGSLVVLPATPAAAHARLISSTPAAGALVDEVPDTVTLEFNESVEADFGQLQVFGPDGERLDEAPPTAEGSIVTSEIGAATSAGMHTIAFRIISSDGHPVEGEVTYEVSEAAVATVQGDAAEQTDETTEAPEPTEPAVNEPEEPDLSEAEETAPDGGAPILPIVLVALAALAVAGALFARRSGADAAPPGSG